jgi:CRISPR-associated protein Cas6
MKDETAMSVFWQEEIDEEQYVVPDRVLDLIFKIKCASLPVDHAWILSEAIHRALPWFADEPRTGLHLIHGAESGNGWQRPDDAGGTLYLSRRTPLILRLPRERIEDAATLSGLKLDIAGNPLEIGASHTRFLAMSNTLYCRHVVSAAEQDEAAFLQQAIAELESMDLRFKKVLCGKGAEFACGDGRLVTRSLMVAGLSLDDAVTLQEWGIGPLRSRGFGLFVPHKPV